MDYFSSSSNSRAINAFYYFTTFHTCEKCFEVLGIKIGIVIPVSSTHSF